MRTMEEHRGAWSAAGAAVMTLAGGGAIAWGLAASPAQSGIPQWPLFVFAVIAAVGFYGVLAPLLRWWPWLETDGPDHASEHVSTPSNGLLAIPAAPLVTVERPAIEAPQRIFDEAPPGLADMSSLKELFAGRTEAQASKLLEQHRGKPVRVSGEVEDVSLASSYRGSVQLVGRARVPFLLFFDVDAEDPEGQLLLGFKTGDKLVVSGVINSIKANLVALDRCKVIDVRGRPS